ncbi:MAG: YceH family protein [Candidatus Cloacimonetes bacterium]|nr:YceH family protein [Candidatus Cloacimonadota bacterium]
MEILNEIEARILGALIEKQYTTPEYYPLTLNSLTLACNQKSNRDPIMELEETTVLRTLDNLIEKKLVFKVEGFGHRVAKYEQSLIDVLKLDDAETAIIETLLLRGAQTLGELKTRTNRIYKFEELSEVETVIQTLSEREEPLVIKLPRRTGHKENRFMHLLSGEIELSEEEFVLPDEKARIEIISENERITALEREVEELKQKLISIEESFREFKKQFE